MLSSFLWGFGGKGAMEKGGGVEDGKGGIRDGKGGVKDGEGGVKDGEGGVKDGEGGRSTHPLRTPRTRLMTKKAPMMIRLTKYIHG